jgi:hypothetical protein
MGKIPKRDNVYYEGRLKRDNQAVYEDYKAGRYPTLHDALIASGLKKRRTRLNELKNAWLKSSASERRAFVDWLKRSAGTVAPGVSRPAFTSDHYLEPWAKERIQKILTSRGITARSIRDQIGMAANDTSLESAMRGSRILRQSVREKIDWWLASQP